jgi:hypothetical protein
MATANGPPADSPEARGLRDPDLDLPTGHSVRRRQRRHGTYQGYQRLVANPFLALLATIAWFFLIVQIVKSKQLVLFWPALVSVVLVVFLFQFHCLDCGTTGRLTRWRDHACEPVRLRYEAGFSRRVRFPNPVVQTVFWFYVLLMVAIFCYVIMQ